MLLLIDDSESVFHWCCCQGHAHSILAGMYVRTAVTSSAVATKAKMKTSRTEAGNVTGNQLAQLGKHPSVTFATNELIFLWMNHKFIVNDFLFGSNFRSKCSKNFKCNRWYPSMMGNRCIGQQIATQVTSSTCGLVFYLLKTTTRVSLVSVLFQSHVLWYTSAILQRTTKTHITMYVSRKLTL